MKYPIAFEVLVMSRDLAFRRHQDRMRKADQYDKMSIDYPTEYDIIEIAAALLDFLDQYCVTFMDETNPPCPTEAPKPSPRPTPRPTPPEPTPIDEPKPLPKEEAPTVDSNNP